MLDSLVATAFLMGIVSACSLPLGTLTAAFWKPGDRMAGALVAFGSGALLAALTIDLVAPAFARGHFYSVAGGCVLGGVLFYLLNEIVNNYGGFLRKVSTTVYHLRRREHRRFKRILSHLGRMDIFRDLSADEFKPMTALMFSRDYEQGAFLYRLGDPPDALYIVAGGEVQLLDPEHDMQPFVTLQKNDAFGRMAFLAGKPHATVAVASDDATVWMLPRSAFERLLPSTPELVQAMHRWLRSEELLVYLQRRQGMAEQDARDWTAAATQALAQQKVLPPISDIDHKEEQFRGCFHDIRRVPLFKQLSEQSINAIASRLIYKHFKRGDTLFQKDDQADRMFVLHQGEVTLVDSGGSARKSKVLGSLDAFGGLSFFTGSRHTTSAVATQDTFVWVLRKQDFDQLLQENPELDAQVKNYLQQEEILLYLESEQHFDPGKAMSWINAATRNIDAGRLIPAADEMATKIRQSKGAPIAIWLGIFLDGVPESLVIGASLVQFEFSLALLAGLFLSNYPEALFSSIGMRQQGMSFARVLAMWTSLMLFTGLGAALGNLLFVEVEPFALSIVQGIAAGAMLTMIAQTMMPEAYFKGGSVIGLATLMGFLAALFFKSIG